MRNIFVIFILCTLMFQKETSAAQFVDCGSKSGKFTKVEISDCTASNKECILKRNTSVSITIDFTLAEDVKAINTVVHGKVLGINMPFHLQNPNACVGTGLQCPLSKGQSYEYKASLPVLAVYPKVGVIIKWELQDEKGVDIICLQVPARIQ